MTRICKKRDLNLFLVVNENGIRVSGLVSYSIINIKRGSRRNCILTLHLVFIGCNSYNFLG